MCQIFMNGLSIVLEEVPGTQKGWLINIYINYNALYIAIGKSN